MRCFPSLLKIAVLSVQIELYNCKAETESLQ